MPSLSTSEQMDLYARSAWFRAAGELLAQSGRLPSAQDAELDTLATVEAALFEADSRLFECEDAFEEFKAAHASRADLNQLSLAIEPVALSSAPVESTAEAAFLVLRDRLARQVEMLEARRDLLRARLGCAAAASHAAR